MSSIFSFFGKSKAALREEQLSKAAASFQLGKAKESQSEYEAAGRYYRQAAEELPEDEDVLLGKYLNNAVFVMTENEEYAQATPLAEKALKISEHV
jgi:tetratricopeptide (TPR) repeat protein